MDSRGGKPRLTLVNYPTGYILKPQVKEFEAMPEAEHLVMAMAARLGIKTVPNALVIEGDRLAYITRRVDRIFRPDGYEMLAMEDFCQLDGRLTQDKYRASYERCVKIIEKYSARRGLDLSELYLRLLFSFLVGNSDMHLKNFSLLETGQGTASYTLSPAYDLVPVKLFLPEDQEDMALSLNGKKMNLRLKDFFALAAYGGIPVRASRAMAEKVLSMEGVFSRMTEESRLPLPMKGKLNELIRDRARRLAIDLT